MHEAVRANILSYFAQAPEEELLKLDEDYLDMAIVLCARKVMELENLVFPNVSEGKPG